MGARLLAEVEEKRRIWPAGAVVRRACSAMVGTRRGASAGGRARRQARRGAGLGWAGDARDAGVGGLRLQARPASAVGRKRGGGPRRRKALFHLYFQEIFKCQLSNIILSKKMTSFENVPKIKVE